MVVWGLADPAVRRVAAKANARSCSRDARVSTSITQSGAHLGSYSPVPRYACRQATIDI